MRTASWKLRFQVWLAERGLCYIVFITFIAFFVGSAYISW